MSDTAFERGLYNFFFAVFMCGSLGYQVSRLAFFWNLPERTRLVRESYELFAKRAKSAAPRVEVLVPCYREQSHVMWQTLMFAALLDYLRRGVVLLLDNPPLPANTR